MTKKDEVAPRLAKLCKIAESVTAPPERLRAVAREFVSLPMCERLGTALLRHPNTPPETLLLMVGKYAILAKALVDNPILPLLALEDPGFFLHLPAAATPYLLRRPDLPRSVVTLLTAHRDPWTIFEARTHIAVAGEAGPDIPPEELASEWDAALCRTLTAIAEDMSLPARALLFELAEEGIAPAWAAVGHDPEQDPIFRSDLARIPREAIEDAARQGFRAMEHLEEWARANGRHRIDIVIGRQGLARSTYTDSFLLRRLAREGDALLRRALRRNWYADDSLRDICRRFAVREAVSTTMPGTGERRLARGFALRHPAFRDLYGDRESLDIDTPSALDTSTRLGILVNLDALVDPETPDNLVRREIFADDANRYVRAAARGNWRMWPGARE